MTVCLQLFAAFFYVGLFSIGGGYASLPLIQHQTVDIHNWLTMEQYLDLVAISAMTPGPIAINASTFVGMRTAGILGAISATAGCVTPSCIIVSLLSFCYMKYKNLTTAKGILSALRPCACSLIASAGLSIIMMLFWDGGMADFLKTDFFSVFLFTAGMIMLLKFKMNQIFVMLFCGILGLIKALIFV